MQKKKRPAKAAKNWAYSYKKFTLPTFRSPLADEGDIRFRDEVDHAFFLRCCELYRVLDLLERNQEKLVDVYSKYRKHSQFTETLTFRYFDSEEALVAKFDPRLAASAFFLFNFLYELRISLTYTDNLPGTVKTEIDDSLYTLRTGWNELVDGVVEKYGWKFRKLLVLDPTSSPSS
ncbi:MAG: hypothetical protein ACXWSD_00485 [Bdellovibrionota bacterium]